MSTSVPRAGRVVREQLQGHDVQQLTARLVLRHTDDVQAFAAVDACICIGQHIEHAATGTHFVQIALEFFQQRVVGGYGHHRHLAGHQRQGAVLEFTGGVSLGVDVADFLEL